MEENGQSATDNESQWYFVIIQNPGTDQEQFVGFENPDTQEKFIPAFKDKDQAKACFTLMPKEVFSSDYDTHAVIQEDLVAIAAENDHTVYVLDGTGRIIDQLDT